MRCGGECCVVEVCRCRGLEAQGRKQSRVSRIHSDRMKREVALALPLILDVIGVAVTVAGLLSVL